MDIDDRARNLGRLWWLTDAPLFIDNRLTSRIHDAVIWPELKEEYVQKTKFDKVTSAFEGKGGIHGGAEFNLPEPLKWLGPKLEAQADLEGRFDKKNEQESSKIVKGERINSPERKLYDIAVEYLSTFPDRVLFVDVPGGTFSNYEGTVDRADLDALLNSPPRPLVFVNVKKGAPLFPTMAEMEDGDFRPIYPSLDERLLKGVNPTPRYDDTDKKKRANYWAEIKKNFSSRTAMQELEKSCSPGRIGWIDFRILFDDDGLTGHLHVVPSGKSHAGVFGYNFVHRGFKYGCRIITTLKSGLDLNVLAIYER